MEGLKEIAATCYKQWSQPEKDQANEFFRKLDANADGRVSFAELRNSGLISQKSFLKFNQFDVNGDGVLDFDEILTLFYYKHKAKSIVKKYKPRPRRCNGCRTKTWPDYSCFFCLQHSSPFCRNKTYDLCYTCYYRGEYSTHKHAKWCMLNHHSLAMLKVLKTILSEVDKKHDDKDYMEFLKKIEVGIGMVGVAVGVVGAAASVGMLIVTAAAVGLPLGGC